MTIGFSSVVLAATALALITPSAAAQETPYANETIISYPTAFPEVGEVLSNPLVVTDEELASVATTTAIATEPDASPDLIVDGPPEVECPNADFASIQAAVLTAPPESEIRVCPGNYNETVTLPKPMTIFALRHQGEATQCPSDSATDPTRYAIVDSPGLADGFRLEANGILIEGFVAQGNTRGIVTSPAFSDYVIRHTVVQNNVSGIDLQGTGFDSGEVQRPVIEHSCLRRNDGALISASQSISARVEENFIIDNRFLHVNGTDARIVHNDVIHTQRIDLFGSGLMFAFNHVVGSSIFARLSGSEIGFNRVENGVGIGIHVEELGGNLITSNHVAGSTGSGLVLEQGRGNTVRGNKIQQNLQDGIHLLATTNNTLDNNLSRDNGADGLRVQSASNTLERNKMLGNSEHDCHDDTVGPGTAGTANFWIDDIGRTENRPGLCKNATTMP